MTIEESMKQMKMGAYPGMFPYPYPYPPNGVPVMFMGYPPPQCPGYWQPAFMMPQQDQQQGQQQAKQ